MTCVICKVLAQQHTSLHESSRKNVQLLANEMYVAGLISSFTVVLGFMSSLSETE